MYILAIDTSADETSTAIVNERQIVSNFNFSQVALHQNFGGIYPLAAKREHALKIQPAVDIALKRARLSLDKIDAFAVTFGPGLAPALEIGILKAKELATKYNKPLIPVDHIEGHIYSSFVQNSNGNPQREFSFPLLAFVISGGHTELVLLNDHINYQILGETLDDAAGEALDKASRLLGLGYPGGPIIERLALKGNKDRYPLPLPMQYHSGLDFSYSGLKTAFKRIVDNLSAEEKVKNLPDLCASYQETTINSLIFRLQQTLKKYPVKTLVLGGGVSSNRLLKSRIRSLCNKKGVTVYFPPTTNLSTDNAAMIAVAAYYKFKKGIYLTDPSILDRIPRANLDKYIAPLT